MDETYFHSDEIVISAPARRCYELVLAIRRYSQWWPQVCCEPLGVEGTLRPGSRFRVRTGPASWLIEVSGLRPWRRIDLQYVEGDVLGPVSWEFIQHGRATLVRFAHRGVQPNSESMRQAFAGGFGARLQSLTLQQEALAGMRRMLEEGYDLTGGDLFEAIHTLRSVRKFRPDPIPDAVLQHIIEAATRAPSARNAQPWRFVVVRDLELKRAIAALYLSAWEQARAYTSATDADVDVRGRPDYGRMMRSVDDLARHLDQAPVLVFAGLDTAQLGPMADPAGNLLSPQSAYASIFPAVQNLMLAARGLGIGSTLTTVFFSVESEIRTLLGIPAHVHLAALIPLGYPTRRFEVTKRKPVTEVTFLNRWGVRFVPT